ncbi:MAG TPA: Hsp20/alpha crystallin family protein [Bacteroidetes bacterium]|nr:Hsp20/alpha crystallin family protein [Bacteroidota bacterium]
MKSPYRKPVPAQQQKGGGRDSDLELYFEYVFGHPRPAMLPTDTGWHPAADLFETEKEIVIVVDIAGIDPRDVSLILHKELLSLKGVRREPSGEEKRQYHKMEVSYGPFERVFRLPGPVESEQVRADYKGGFLFIRLQKCERLARGKVNIPIR